VASDPLPFHPRVPAVLRAVILACLERDPVARPSLAEVSDMFGALQEGARDTALRRLRRRMR
jgi:hypothetical protein